MAARCSLIVLMLLLASCSPATPPLPTDQTPAKTAAVVDATKPAETPTVVPNWVKELLNAQYQLGTPDTLQVVQLKDGKFQRGGPGDTDYASVNVTDFVASGDLDGDGTDELTALVAENYGGSGVFVFLAVYKQVSGKPAFQSSVLSDYRPQLNALSIANGEVFVDATVHGFDDPACCPALRTARHYRLIENNQLDMADYSTFTADGRPRTITIEAPTHGTLVYKSILVNGKVAIASFEDNLTYRIYDVGGVNFQRARFP